MKLSLLYGLLIGSFALAQNDYLEPNKDYLWTTKPTTPLPYGAPWGDKTADSDPNPPFTGVIRRYNWTVARGVKAPDGYEKEGLFVNGQLPGPPIEANWGDTIEVTIHNAIYGPEDGTAIHWHGITQKGTVWQDGIPGVQQCPIVPGKSFTYTFIADQYGTSWWHSHYAAQYADGLYGPMIIHGPKHVEYDIDKGPVIISDYFHATGEELSELSVSDDIDEVVAFSNNNLINGRNSLHCYRTGPNDTTPCVPNAGVSKFRFSPGKRHLLRLINAGGDGQQKFSIDGHELTIISTDFVRIKPYTVKTLTVGIGQRFDVIVKGLRNTTDAYTMRSTLASCSDAYQPNATAIVYYSHKNLVSNSKPWPELEQSLGYCGNDDIALSVPWYPMKSFEPSTTDTMLFDVARNASGNYLWVVNNSAFRGNYNLPVLLLSNQGNNSYPYSPDWNVYDYGKNASIRLILRNPGFAVHPMHLHGHNFQIVAAGPGEWDGHTIVNPDNPIRRDTVLIPAASYAVIQFEADNPGTWPFHCHIAGHVAGGLYVNIFERTDEIAKIHIPAIIEQTCRDYEAWQAAGNVVNQVDSGV
ncbi:related to laccase precursor [Rhynchosporium agropyri]|uniref:Related to laccase n=1 Tax=Rhynchosporium agropyri TaxID=914238 RepID=A0A1E1KQ12_9HELO|nr:related to laccase precursor [Rhynchosporium agropyri]